MLNETFSVIFKLFLFSKWFMEMENIPWWHSLRGLECWILASENGVGGCQAACWPHGCGFGSTHLISHLSRLRHDPIFCPYHFAIPVCRSSLSNIRTPGPSASLRLFRHSVWKLLKMSHLNFLILAFATNFCPIKTDLSGNTVWPQASGFQKFTKRDHFWHF